MWLDSLSRLARNKAAVGGAFILIATILMAIFAPVLAPQPYDETNFDAVNTAPSWLITLFPTMKPISEGGYMTVNNDYRLGTNSLGRDCSAASSMGRGFRSGAIVGPFIMITIGLTLGVIAGYVGGKVDNLIMRIVDIMYAFPTLPC